MGHQARTRAKAKAAEQELMEQYNEWLSGCIEAREAGVALDVEALHLLATYEARGYSEGFYEWIGVTTGMLRVVVYQGPNHPHHLEQ